MLHYEKNQGMAIKKLRFFISVLCMFSMKQEKKDRILFFGDSITQMGTNNGGYIDLLKKILKKTELQSSTK
jgi:hypothetical protein